MCHHIQKSTPEQSDLNLRPEILRVLEEDVRGNWYDWKYPHITDYKIKLEKWDYFKFRSIGSKLKTRHVGIYQTETLLQIKGYN